MGRISTKILVVSAAPEWQSPELYEVLSMLSLQGGCWLMAHLVLLFRSNLC